MAKVTKAALTRRAACLAGGCALLALASGALAGCAGSDAGAGGQEEPVASVPADTSAAVDDQPASRAFFAFDSLVSLKAYGASEELFDEIQQECLRFDGLFSAHSDASDIARINAAGGNPVEVDQDTADLISDALALCEELDGAFDVTIGAVSLLWDFQEGVKPADADIEAALAHVDWRGVQVDGTTVTLADPKAKLDLGGVAKGWICERVVERLRAAGVTSGIVNLGTSSDYVLGTKPDGSPWGIGLRDPRGALGTLMGKISASEAAITSSGLYDQCFELDGTTYWHILDPATGYPVQTDMLGVTTVGSSPTEGDALSTALFVMGTEAAKAWLAEKRPGAGALFIGEDDEPTFTDGFAETYAYAPIVQASGTADSAAGE